MNNAINNAMNNTELEDSYPFIISDLMAYIEKIKRNDRCSFLIDIIMDYSIKNGFDPEMIGDAIANDVYFKSFVEKDCRVNGIIGVNKCKTDIGNW